VISSDSTWTVYIGGIYEKHFVFAHFTIWR